MDTADAMPVVTSTAAPAGLSPAQALDARALLLNEPSFRVELTPPAAAIIAQELMGDVELRKHHRFRTLLFAIAVSVPDGMQYGRAQLVVLEGEPRPGRSTILAYDEAWFTDLHNIAVDLADRLRDLRANTTLEPEPGGLAWVEVIALLGGGVDPARESPPDWRRRFETIAALYAVHLDVRPNPD
jgi:hypothetical protein